MVKVATKVSLGVAGVYGDYVGDGELPNWRTARSAAVVSLVGAGADGPVSGPVEVNVLR